MRSAAFNDAWSTPLRPEAPPQSSANVESRSWRRVRVEPAPYATLGSFVTLRSAVRFFLQRDRGGSYDAAMLLLLLAACGVSLSSDCEITNTTSLADDEVTALGISADDVLAVGAGTRTVPGTLEDGTPITATLDAVRAAGDATFTETELVTTKHPNGMLFGETQNSMGIICRNTLSVPITMSVSSDDGSIDYSEAGTVFANDGDLLDFVSLDSSVAPADASGMPTVDEVGIEEAFAQADIVDGGTLVTGNAGWQGSTDTSSWARYMIEFETPSRP